MARLPSTPDSAPSVGQLVASIKDDVTGLVRGEIDLAKAELREEAKQAGVGGGMIAVAAALGLLALVLLSIALVYGVSALGLTLGWSYLVVGGAYLVLAGLLGLLAKGRFAHVKGPQRARASAQRAVEALRPSSQRP